MSLVCSAEIKIRRYHVDVYGYVGYARWVELLEKARWRWLDEVRYMLERYLAGALDPRPGQVPR